MALSSRITIIGIFTLFYYHSCVAQSILCGVDTSKYNRISNTELNVFTNPSNNDFYFAFKGLESGELSFTILKANSGLIDYDRRGPNMYIWLPSTDYLCLKAAFISCVLESQSRTFNPPKLRICYAASIHDYKPYSECLFFGEASIKYFIEALDKEVNCSEIPFSDEARRKLIDLLKGFEFKE